MGLGEAVWRPEEPPTSQLAPQLFFPTWCLGSCPAQGAGPGPRSGGRRHSVNPEASMLRAQPRSPGPGARQQPKCLHI